MVDTGAATAFDAVLPDPPPTKFERERRAFHRLLPDLLATHRGRYVAVHDGQVVDSGPDQLDVAMRVWQRVGNVPIYVALVTDDPPPVFRSGLLADLGRWRSGT